MGVDGIGIEILKFFWPDLKHYYLEMSKEAYNTISLPEFQSHKIFSSIDKHKDLLKIKK